MNKKTANEISTKVRAFLNKEYPGMHISMPGRYGETSATFTLRISEKNEEGVPLTRKYELVKLQASLLNLTLDWVYSKNLKESVRLTGYNTRASRYPYEYEAESGILYKCSEALAKNIFKK